jgi:heterodisulfide reductase subunit C
MTNSSKPPAVSISGSSSAAASPEYSLLSRIKDITGLDPAQCYQCGKCSAGCPMASEMDLKPHEMMRLLQLDCGERLLSSESIWMCLTCETCSTRCPNLFDPAAVIDALRETALKENRGCAPRKIAAFHTAFLNQIRTNGRIFEFGLAASYKLRSGALLSDVDSVPGMLVRGKLALAPRRIRAIRDIRRIFKKCTMEKA